MNPIRNVIIFGATSAIAQQVARLLVQDGASVYCVGRNADKLSALLADLRVRASSSQRIEGYVADLQEHEYHGNLLDRAIAALGTIDAVLIAHGTLPDQKRCESDIAYLRNEIDANALSVICLLTVLANHFEAQGRGVIAVISSVAGDRGRQSNYAYGAAKGMVSLFLQGLRNRLARKGVHVLTIKPGFVDTPMTRHIDKSGPLWVGPDVIARGIVHAMRKGRNQVYLPWFWHAIMLVIRNIPETVFKRMSL